VELTELFAVTAKTLTELIAELVAELVGKTELLVKLASGMELKAQIKIQQPEELEVLLIAIRY
jgi:hypothetical protein